MSGSEPKLDGILKIGQMVKVGLKTSSESGQEKPSEGDHRRTHSSHIDDVLPEELVVAWPIQKAEYVPASAGQGVILEIRCEQGVYRLDSRIIAAKEVPAPVWHIARNGDWSKSQLRTSVRLSITIVPHAVALVSSDARAGAVDIDALRNNPKRGVPLKAMIRNLSAAGVYLASATCLELGSIVRISFPLAKGQADINAHVMVVRTVEGRHVNREYPFNHGCRFLDVGMREQDGISGFILAKQAELRRKGAL